MSTDKRTITIYYVDNGFRLTDYTRDADYKTSNEANRVFTNKEDLSKWLVEYL